MSTTFLEQWLASSPFVAQLGMKVARLERDAADVLLPFREQNVTIGDVVHGGAVASLIDSAATAAAWTAVEDPANTRGTTVAMTVNYVAAARSVDLTARARVVRRGKTLVFVDVEVVDGSETLVAKGLVTYKLD